MRGALCGYCADIITHDDNSNFCSEVCELRSQSLELVTVERDGKKHQEWQHRPAGQLHLLGGVA